MINTREKEKKRERERERERRERFNQTILLRTDKRFRRSGTLHKVFNLLFNHTQVGNSTVVHMWNIAHDNNNSKAQERNEYRGL